VVGRTFGEKPNVNDGSTRLDHINVLGRYEFALKESVRKGDCGLSERRRARWPGGVMRVPPKLLLRYPLFRDGIAATGRLRLLKRVFGSR
jgi:hypothetical protein